MGLVRAAVVAMMASATAARAAPPPRIVTAPVDSASTRAPPVLFLNRCPGGCVIRKGYDDARARTSSLLQGAGTIDLVEGVWEGERWTSLVQCVREVYSPYGITVTDVAPEVGSLYNEVIIAGDDLDLGFENIGGIAPFDDDCRPLSNVISFAFPGKYAVDNVYGLCWAVAQESGHALGLDHSYGFASGASACSDPMSYRADCNVQRFFRDAEATCGESAPRPCACGAKQNTHAQLLSLLGPGTPITSGPSVNNVEIRTNYGLLAVVDASAQRGVDMLELWINDYRWAVLRPPYASSGTFEIAAPRGLPGGILDVVVVAIDDLGGRAESPMLTVTRGDPCADASTCADGQRCDAGRCRWDAPVGQLGDACDYPQFCTSGMCVLDACSQLCDRDDPAACGDGFTCRYIGPEGGACVAGEPEPPAGCTSTSPTGAATPALLALLAACRRRRTAAGVVRLRGAIV